MNLPKGVVIAGIPSGEFKLNSGVPKGFVLPATLFRICINELCSLTVNPLYYFTDDSNIRQFSLRSIT